jgi:Tol biopolymer transport system component
VETRFYDERNARAEDYLGVHRRVYREGLEPLDYRLDGTHRQRWLPPLNAGKRLNQEGAWHPVATPDGREMYYEAGFNGENRPRGRQGIVRVDWLSDRWSDPQPVLAGQRPVVGLRPAVSSDGTVLAFVAWKSNPFAEHGETEYPNLPNYGQADVYVTERVDGVWQPVRNAGPKINGFNESLGVAFVPGTHTLCFESNRGGAALTLWLADREGDEWGEPRPLGIGQAAHPRFSDDGRRLFFSSDRKGTLGGSDLWVVDRDDGGWSRPLNLGADVNHDWHDGQCAPLADGELLYFDRCCPWSLWVTGRVDSERAIRHMADIYALGEWE